MIKFEVFYNKAYKHTIELVKQEFKGDYMYIDRVNDLLLIDNVTIAKLEDINQIRFLVNGYYQVINVATPTTKIVATDIEKGGD